MSVMLPVSLDKKWNYMAIDGDGGVFVFSHRPSWDAKMDMFMASRGRMEELSDIFNSREKRLLYRRLAEGWEKALQVSK